MSSTFSVTVTKEENARSTSLNIHNTSKANEATSSNNDSTNHNKHETATETSSVTSNQPNTPVSAIALGKLNVSNATHVEDKTVTKDALLPDQANQKQKKKTYIQKSRLKCNQGNASKTPGNLRSQQSIQEIDGGTRLENDPEISNAFSDTEIQAITDPGLLDESASQSDLQCRRSSDVHHHSHCILHEQSTTDDRISESTEQSVSCKEPLEGSDVIDDNQARSDLPSKEGFEKRDIVILRANDDESAAFKFRDHLLHDFPDIRPPLTVDIFNTIDAGQTELQSLGSLPDRYSYTLLYATESFKEERYIQFLSEVIILYGLNSQTGKRDQFIPVWSKQYLNLAMYIKAIKGLQYWQYTLPSLKKSYMAQVADLIRRGRPITK